jgi:mRNA interferase YafQ
MVYEIVTTNRFKKGLKRAIKRGLDLSLLDEVVEKLRTGKRLEAKFNDHALSGKFNDFRECHVQPDWLLVYLKDDGVLTLTLAETGTHAELFDS